MSRTHAPLNLVARDAGESARGAARQTRSSAPQGIEVHEEELALIKAQLLYRLRCECGRCWFDIQLPKLAACPSCAKMGAVVVQPDAP